MTSLYAHPPAGLLGDHLERVAVLTETTIAEKNFAVADVPQEVLSHLGYLAGAVHDMGKGTKNFQLYLFGKEFTGNKNHALVSAFAGYFLAVKYLEKVKLSDEELSTLLPYFVFTAVKRHHGNLRNFRTELDMEPSDQEQKLSAQIDDFYAVETERIINERVRGLDLDFVWQDFADFVKSADYLTERSYFAVDYIDNEAGRGLRESVRNFYLHQIIYASLLYSDKSDVIIKEKPTRTQAIDTDAVTKYREAQKWNNPTRKIDKRKNSAYQKGLEFLRSNFDPQRHLYSVTMPTGLGKTVTSFALALEMRKMLADKQDARIVITIPFTSIIDQNYEVYADILGQPDSGGLLKHHHLAEPKYKEGYDSVRDGNQSQFLIETWQSQVVVTTFVQLLECLYTNDKAKLMKLPNLTNAIIILDEVQNIPYEIWKPVREVFKFFGDRLNCYFIMMSATQPLIFAPQKEITELIPAYRDYFKFFNRTKLINRTREVISLDEFTDTVAEHFAESEKKDTLIILNSVEVTRICFEELTYRIPADDADIYYLSTRISPFERKEIIKRIKNRPKDGLPVVIVSTQMIEAGADISVHTVFRAIAPLDSIIQAAGRANRYWENPNFISPVYIYRIEELEKANAYIYGGTLLNLTHEVLANFAEVEEKEYLSLIEDYFAKIKMQADYKEDTILPAMKKLEFESVGQFKFISDRKTNSVFVKLNDRAKEVWRQYVRLAENKEMKSYERKKEFASFKSEFYDYVVNVPISYGEDSIDWDDEPQHFFYVWEYNHPHGSNRLYRYAETDSGEPDFRQNTGYSPTTPTF